jgi:hypothetical protein
MTTETKHCSQLGIAAGTSSSDSTAELRCTSVTASAMVSMVLKTVLGEREIVRSGVHDLIDDGTSQRGLENWEIKYGQDNGGVNGGVQLVISDDSESARRVLGYMVPGGAVETCCSLARSSSSTITPGNEVQTCDLVKLLMFQEAAWNDVKETKSCPSPIAIALDLTLSHCREHAEREVGDDDDEHDKVDDTLTHLPGRVSKEIWRTLEVIADVGRFVHMSVTIALTSSDARAFGLRRVDAVVLCPGIRYHVFLHHAYLQWNLRDLFATREAFVAFYDVITRNGSALVYTPTTRSVDIASAFRRLSLADLPLASVSSFRDRK